VRLGVELVEARHGIPGALAGAVDAQSLADEADRLQRYLVGKFRDREAVKLLLSPVEVLTPAFVQALAAAGRRGPLALFLDSYERTGLFLDDWLLKVLNEDYGRLPVGLVITIAGRDPLDAFKWSPNHGVLADVLLTRFSEVEARQLLASWGTTDERIVEKVLERSGRLPLFVDMLAQQRPADPAAVDVSSPAAVKWFLDSVDPARRALAVSAALPRVVDEDVLRVLVEDGEDPRALFGWLCSLTPMIEQAPGRYRYHEMVHTPMLRLERGQSPARWCEQHRQLAELYRSRRTARVEPDAWDDESWRALRLEEAYHRLCAQAPGALPKALRGVLHACGEQVGAAAPWIQAIAQAGQDAGDTAAHKWAQRLVNAQLRQDNPSLALVELLLNSADLDTSARSEAHRLRGRERRRSGKYEMALANYNRALSMDSGNHTAYAGRAVTYQAMGRHDDALVDYNRAIELNSTNAGVITARGETYEAMGRYDDALADRSRAIELDPTNARAITARGETYRMMGRYDAALADHAHAIELDPDSGMAYLCSALAWCSKADEGEAAAALVAAVRLLERAAGADKSTADDDLGLMLCRAAQLDFDGAHRLAARLLDRKLDRWQLANVRRVLGELADVPGMDRAQINTLKVRLELADDDTTE
jgi:tetratricopeptide (TPR) repeat protein